MNVFVYRKIATSEHQIYCKTEKKNSVDTFGLLCGVLREMDRVTGSSGTEDRQCTYDVTLVLVYINTVAVEKE